MTWSDAEKAALQAAAKERRAAKRKLSPAEARAEGEREVRERIAAMAEPDRALATGVHELVFSVAPDLVPRLWYGMPAWAKDGKVICFFQDAGKFKVRYSTLGFQQDAALDAGRMWATSFALLELNTETRERIAALVRRATGG